MSQECRTGRQTLGSRFMNLATEPDRVSFLGAMRQGWAVWLEGAFIYWIIEFVFVIIALPRSWDYGFLRDGMPASKALALTLRPEDLALGLLLYSGFSSAAGLLSGALFFPVTGRVGRPGLRALLASAFLSFSLIVIGGLWLYSRLKPELLTVKGLAAYVLFAVFCALSACFSYGRLRKIDEGCFPLIFASYALSLDAFLLGGAYVAKVYLPALLTTKAAAFLAVLMGAGAGLFFLARYALCRPAFGHALTSRMSGKWRLVGVAALLICAASVVAQQEGVLTLLRRQDIEGRRSQPNVVLIVMDTTRADHLSCYGYTRVTSPCLDRIAAEGTLFRNAISPSSWTLPSHASIFTGLSPSEHAVGHVSSYLPVQIPTIATLLKEDGYRTLFYSNNPWVSVYTGLDRGFDQRESGWKEHEDRYLFETVSNLLRLVRERNNPAWRIQDDGAAKTTQYVAEWIEKNRRSPFFVFINYMEPHMPYSAPAPYYRRYMPADITPEEVRRFSPSGLDIRSLLVPRERSGRELTTIGSLYDGEVGYLDGRIEELYQRIKDLGLLDNTLLIITSDHGENLGDHGLVGHMYGLYGSLIDVPLIIRYPRMFTPGTVIRNPVLITDIFYTIQEAVGLRHRIPPAGVGKSLIRRIAGGEFQDEIVTEHDRPTNALRWARNRGIDTRRIDQDQRAILRGSFEFVLTSRGDQELYDRSRDPVELTNIAGECPEITADLKGRLAHALLAMRPPLPARTGPEMDKETKERLRSLGYIR